MAVRLRVRTRIQVGGAAPTDAVSVYPEPVLLGRDPSCQVVLAQQAVSRSHARITQDGALFFVEDLGSSFGTLVNGRTLPKGEKRLLQRGDVIAIATFDVTFEGEAEPEGPDEGSQTGYHAKRAVKKVMRTLVPGSSNPYFRVMNGPTEGQRIEFAEGQEYVLGRDEAAADVVLGDDLVSRRHAKVRRDWSGVHLEDLESRNGVKVNRKRIHRADLKDRDEVEVGGVRFLFIDPSEVRDLEPVPIPVLATPLHAPAQPAAPLARPEPVAPLPEPVPEPEPEPEPAAVSPAAEAPPERELTEAGGLLGETEPPRLDLSNRQTQVALAVGGVIFLVGLVLVILLVAGA